jgi:biopolymer transport protein TolR
MSTEKRVKRTVPFINVTPLIDVLLVLLIIFMVVTPIKPSRFVAQIPEPPKPEELTEVGDVLTLVVNIKPDGTLELNHLSGMGTVNDTGKLSAALRKIFQGRKENHAYRWDMTSRNDLPEEARIQKTVFIKAPKTIPYGEVVKVLDGIKVAGADPVGLQVDALD